MGDKIISAAGDISPAQAGDLHPVERGSGNGYLSNAAIATFVATYLALGTAATKNTGTSAGQVPLLDGSGLLDTSILPSIAITDTFIVASQVAMLALTAQQGDIAVRTDLNKSFVLSTNSPSTLADWKELLTPTDAVLSVAGITGAISASALRTALALVIGTDVQAFDADLTAIAALVSAANKRMGATGTGTWALFDDTTFFRTLGAAADAPAFRALIGNAVTDPTSVTDIRPNLDLDFTSSNGAPFDDTFTRALSGGYRVNSKGILVPTVANEPVIDFAYDGTPLGTGFWGAYTQLCLQSETFDNASWAKTRSTITANAAVAPDGTTTADKIVEDATATNSHQLSQICAANTSQMVTYSVYAKAAERTKLKVYLSDTAAGTNSINGTADLSTGATLTGIGGNGSTPSAKMDALPNGWWRFSLSGIPNTGGSAGNVTAQTRLVDGSSSESYTGDGSSGLYLWGGEFAQTAFLTPYLASTSSTVTRNADSMVISGTDFTDFFNPLEGTIYAEIHLDSADAVDRVFLQIDDGSDNNRIMLGRTGSTGKAAGNVKVGGVDQAALASVANMNAGLNKLMLSYKANSFALTLNGATVVTDVSGTLPTVTTWRIGSFGGVAPNCHIKRVFYVPRQLSSTLIERAAA